MAKRVKTTSLAAWLSLSIATAAVVLSQLPPIRSYFASAQMEVSAGRQVYIEHVYGHIVLQPLIQFINKGSAVGRVRSLRATLGTIDGGATLSLWGDFYFDLPTSVGSGHSVVPRALLDIDVGPTSTWKRHVRLSRRNSDNELEELMGAKRRIWNELSRDFDAMLARTAALDLARPVASGTETVERSTVAAIPAIGDALFREIVEDVDRRLAPFGRGNFVLRLEARGEGDVAVGTSCYKFALSSEHRRALDMITVGYKTGHGVIYPAVARGVDVNLHEEDCSNVPLMLGDA